MNNRHWDLSRDEIPNELSWFLINLVLVHCPFLIVVTGRTIVFCGTEQIVSDNFNIFFFFCSGVDERRQRWKKKKSMSVSSDAKLGNLRFQTDVSNKGWMDLSDHY